MSTIAYVFIAVAAIVGLIIGIFLSPRRKKGQTENEQPEQVSTDPDVIASLEQTISSLRSKCEELQQIADNKSAELSHLQEQMLSGADSSAVDILEKMKTENEESLIKLKKQLEDAEEELEEAEDNAKKFKRQLAEKVDENGQLLDQISSANRQINDLTSGLESTKNKLEQTSKDLESVAGSLSFVQEVLTATPINSESFIEKDKRINTLSNFIFFDLQELFKQYFTPSDFSNYIFGQGLFQWEAVKRKSWIEGKKTIAFIGEFSAGKTSIVNRILSQDNPDVTLLPVSAKATTAIPTYIAGGDYTTYQFYSPDGNLKGISEETFKKVSKEILGNIEGVSELIKYFVMTYQNPHLEGLSILDTPGFSSGDKEDAVRTIDVINECDALFWVFDVNAGTVNRSSLAVIKDNMQRPLYIIINKTDTKAKSEVDAVEDLIRREFDEAGIKVESYIRFSSKAPLDELMGVIQSIPNDSSAEEYLSNLTEDFIPTLINACSEDDKNAGKELDASNKKCDKKWDAIINLCQRIQNDSIDAANIPHWETHWLSKDRYEMDENEGQRLRNLLEKVANDEIVKLSEEIGEYGNLMQENQYAYQNKNKENATLRQFQDYQSKIARLINDLNR